MHPVLGGLLHLDRQEGPCPDMQGQPVQFDAAAAQRRFQVRREMQSRGRRGDGAIIHREHGLVVGGIAIVRRALRRNVGRQRRRAEIGNGLIERRPVKRERQRNLALLALGLDLGVEMAEQADLAFIAEANDIARRELLRRLDQRAPARAIQPLDQRRLDLRLGRAADTAAFQLGGDHLGVVDDKLVAGLQPLRQLGDGAVMQRAIRLHHQHARRIARPRGPQRDAGGGEFEVEEIGAHGPGAACPVRSFRGASKMRTRSLEIPGSRFACPGMTASVQAASTAMCALTILSGFCTGSPRLILSTFSMPDVTLPQTVYWPLRNDASSKQMKNWLSPESGLLARAIEVVPRTCGSLLNSALSFLPEPPVPVPSGHPVSAMKPSITPWNTMPS